MNKQSERSRQYWHNVLVAGGNTTIPRWTLNPSSAVLEHKENISGELVAGLRTLAEESSMPIETLLLAAHAKVLTALSGEAKVTTGYIAKAGDQALPCRLAIEPGSWRELLGEVHRCETELLSHGNFPIEELARELKKTQPAFESLFNPTSSTSPLSEDTLLSISIARDAEELTLCMQYRAEVLDAQSASRICGYHLKALALMVADPDAEHAAQSLLSKEEIHFQIEGFAGPKRELPESRLHELFEQRASAEPDTVAGVCGDKQWTYRELNERANQLGRALLARGLEAESVVAVVTERNLDWMASVLSIFKAGGVYLPIEPHFPSDRIARMLTRADCKLVLSESGSDTFLDQALESQPQAQKLFIAGALEEGHDVDNLGIKVTANQAAYIFFTSGSTGEPKGALCEHDGMINHLLAKIEDCGLKEGQALAQVAPQCFDISMWQLVAALLVGGRTVIIEQEVVLDVQRFVETISSGKVSVMQVVPSYLEVILSLLDANDVELPHLHCVSVTGEAISKELTVRWFAAKPEIKIVNAYGLTETSDDTNHEVMDRPPAGNQVPLGPCVQNVHVYVVDENLSPVPLGAPGEIVFSGVCVGRCYVNDPERTSQAFLADPLREGERIYMSGDFGRWSPDRKLEFLGRRDAQVKIRGFRIEIGDIENALLGVDGVTTGAVVITERNDASKQLVAFYSGPDSTSADAVESSLTRSLPEYMVPSFFHWQETLPLTVNGKIDKKLLKTLATELNDTSGAFEAPETPSEQKVVAAWAKVLGVDAATVSRRDNFFDQGGTSLSAVKLVVGLERKVSLRDVMKLPVLADLAARLDTATGDIQDAQPLKTVQLNTAPSQVRPTQQKTLKEGNAMSSSTTQTSLEVDAQPGKPAIVQVTPSGSAASWAAENKDALRASVTQHGAVLVRGLGLKDASEVAAVVGELGSKLMGDKEAFTVRHQHSEGVYSSISWPSNQPMCMHHEMSYVHEPAGLMMFACLTAPTSGGATGVADASAVLEALPADLVKRFEQDGWMLTRNYNEDIGSSYAEVFGTESRDEIEAYCKASNIEYEWQSDGGLRTRQRRPAVVKHPATGQRCWFNQIAFLNEWTLDPEVREFLVEEYGSDGLPFNTSLGNGDAFGEDVVQAINETYDDCTMREPWQAGDLMLVDNVRMAHSREAFEGEREVLVAMADPVGLSD